MHKLPTRWLPKLLALENKRLRELHSAENVQLFEADNNLFGQKFVAMDETWVHHFRPGSKKKSLETVETSHLPLPQKGKGGSIH